MAFEVHTHEDASQGGQLGYFGFKSTVKVSAFGTLAASGIVDIPLTAYCWFPMIAAGTRFVQWVGHSVDGGGADFPRFALFNNNISLTSTYAVDYTYIEAS